MGTDTKHNDLEFGDDLFDFDQLLRDHPLDADDVNAALDAVIATTQLESASDGEPDLLGLDADLFSLGPPAALPAVTHRVQPRPPPLAAPKPTTTPHAPRPAARTAPVAAALAGEPAGALPAASGTTHTTILQRITLSPALAAVLVLIAALNLALVGYVVRALGSVESMVLDVGSQVVSTTERVRAEASSLARDFDANSRPVVSPRPEGLGALERAGELFDAGAFERGRQTLFALLAVIDRVPAEVRVDIEARARFALADSWRLEADALQRTTLASARRPEDPQ